MQSYNNILKPNSQSREKNTSNEAQRLKEKSSKINIQRIKHILSDTKQIKSKYSLNNI